MNSSHHNNEMTDLGNYIFVVGGHVGFSILNTVEFHDLSQDIWIFVSPMSVPRSRLGVASMGNLIYAVGGKIVAQFMT